GSSAPDNDVSKCESASKSPPGGKAPPPAPPCTGKNCPKTKTKTGPGKEGPDGKGNSAPEGPPSNNSDAPQGATSPSGSSGSGGSSALSGMLKSIGDAVGQVMKKLLGPQPPQFPTPSTSPAIVPIQAATSTSPKPIVRLI